MIVQWTFAIATPVARRVISVEARKLLIGVSPRESSLFLRANSVNSSRISLSVLADT